MSCLGIYSLHELIADEFLDLFSLCFDSHMSHKDISLHELIADELSDILSLWFDSHMNHRDISSLHVQTVYAQLKQISMRFGNHIPDR